MGKRVERDMYWMDDVKFVLGINYRPKSEHTIEYEDKEGNYCVVRVPASFIKFLQLIGHTELKLVAKAA